MAPGLTVLSAWRGRVILAVAVGAAAFHLFSAGFSPFTALVQRPVHLALMAALVFLGVGVRQSPARVGHPARARSVNAILALAAIVGCAYMVTQHGALVLRAGDPTRFDLLLGAATLLIVLEMARRTTGWGLVTVAVMALAYAGAGPILPGALAHRGYGPSRIVEHLYLSTEGIWGVPLGVSADFVYLFVLFGAVLDLAGGGELFIGLANRVTASSRGGPAKTAALSSALMGSLSGSAVANVVTTGSFTIPLMRRAGFKPFFAGAIEAAASTGGQVMPPVMGAGAFILATWTNIPYAQVAVAAALPAALFYVALLVSIHLRAQKLALPSTPPVARTSLASRAHLLLPLLVVVAVLALGRSPMRAAFWGVIAAAGASLVRRRTRAQPARWAEGLQVAGQGSVQVAAACAAAGIVVGVASLTGIGLRMSELIVTISGGSLPIALVLTAAGSLVLGLGLPTTAAYVVLAALGAPALVEMGVPPLSAHLFIFYFGAMSNVTPPVSLAAFAASGVAGSPPVKTALAALVLSGAGFVIPFMFVYSPALLLSGAPVDIALSIGGGVLGVTALAASGIGFLRRPLEPWERILLGVGVAGVVYPGSASDLILVATLAFVMFRKPRMDSPL